MNFPVWRENCSSGVRWGRRNSHLTPAGSQENFNTDAWGQKCGNSGVTDAGGEREGAGAENLQIKSRRTAFFVNFAITHSTAPYNLANLLHYLKKHTAKLLEQILHTPASSTGQIKVDETELEVPQ